MHAASLFLVLLAAMRTWSILLLVALGAASLVSSAISDSDIVDDLDVISQLWGQLTPYHDNKPSFFGVEKVGLPDGCGIEQVHVLQRCVIFCFRN
jgi:hypothetical protein